MTNKDILIEKYLYKELSEPEIQEFEQRLDNDVEFADEVELRSVIFAKTKSDFKQQLKAARQEAQENQGTGGTVKLMYYLKRIAAVLILGVLAFVLSRFINNSNTTSSADIQVVASNFIDDEKHTDPTTLKGENDDDAVWKTAKDAYKNGEYPVTIREIEKIKSPDTEQQFYLGLAHLYNKNYDKSITQFESIIQQNNINYSPASKWYISLAYLKNNQTKQAEKYLQQIVEDKSWKYKDAQKLLNRIHEL